MAGKAPYILHFSGQEVETLLDKAKDMPEPDNTATKEELQTATADLQEQIDAISGTAEPLSNEQLNELLALL